MMSGKTHEQRIIELLKERPGLDDDEVARRTRIKPRQTVNQICRRLAKRGLLRRERGPAGKVVNIPGAGEALLTPAFVQTRKPPPDGRRLSIQGSLIPKDFGRTLLVIPCSGAKRDCHDPGEPGAAIMQSLPADLADELCKARLDVKQRVPFNEQNLVPAWQRYDGALYRVGRAALSDFIKWRSHVIILSGGYGAVMAKEPIGLYNTVLKPSWWPSRLIERVLIAYAQGHRIASVRAFVSATSPYSKVLKQTRWQDAGIDDALVFMPQAAPGAMRKSPASQGEALVALRDGTLAPKWRSSYGLGLVILR